MILISYSTNNRKTKAKNKDLNLYCNTFEINIVNKKIFC